METALTVGSKDFDIEDFSVQALNAQLAADSPRPCRSESKV
jgi:hypothetical protein